MPRGIYDRKKLKRKSPKRAAAAKDYNVVTLDLQPSAREVSAPEGYISSDTYHELKSRHDLLMLELVETRIEWLRLQLECAIAERDTLAKQRTH